VSERIENSLLAKSWRVEENPPSSIYLHGHLRDTLHAADEILGSMVDTQLSALGLDPECFRDRLRRIVQLASAVHDLGKCNSQFQGMVRKKHGQVVRHEWVTLMILDGVAGDGFPGWREWLAPALQHEGEDWRLLRWCVSGHHPKYDRASPPEAGVGPAKMDLPLNHRDMEKVVQWLAEEFGLEDQPETPDLSLNFAFGDNGEAALNEIAHRFYEDEDAYELFEPETIRLLAAAKNTLIAADVAGSALPKHSANDNERAAWISGLLDPETLPAADGYQSIVDAHLTGKETENNAREDFQRNVAASKSRVTFVKAGCGTGKTLAAYRWAQAHCAGHRLFICYPTTGTATEGFRDYLLDPDLAEQVKTDLVHGRRKVDFKHILPTEENRDTDTARIESLDLWRIPVVACTVDTVLGVIQNNRRGRFGWPAIAQGGFVFDEIHSYDDKLFDALLHFLQTMRGVPILLMTASLSQQRWQAIKAVLGDDIEPVEGPANLERVKRYRREELDKKTSLHQRVLAKLQKGGKVLRVCNTVDAAIREAAGLAEALEASDLEVEPLIYHSRFRYVDRVQRHQDVIDAFNADGPALAVCTQVAEMSLDLSASLLVTDLAPVPSLIQRLGRLNRYTETDDPRSFIVTDPEGKDGKFSPLPYDADDLELARSWLNQRLGDDDLSQQDLAEAWEAMQQDEGQAEGMKVTGDWPFEDGE